GHRYCGFRRIPTIDAIILARAEVVLLTPFDGTATQALRVDLYVLHCGADFCGIGGPNPALWAWFWHPSAHPPFAPSLGRLAHISFFCFVHDLLVDGQVGPRVPRFLKKRIRADHVEFPILEARQFALGLDVRPGDVVAVPTQPAQRFERLYLGDPRSPREYPV